MISTEIKKRRRGERKNEGKRKIKLSSFFNYLDSDAWDDILAMDDVYVHLLINNVFQNKDNFGNIQTGQKVNGTVEDFYKSVINNEYLGVSCKPYQLRKVTDCFDKEEPMIDFKTYLDKMSEIRSFSLSSVENVWALQESKEAIIRGIMEVRKKEINLVHNLNNVLPMDGLDVNIPALNYYITGVNFPVIIQEAPKSLQIKEVSNKNNDNGIVIVDESDIIYDVIKINDFWLYSYPLSNRIEFLGRFQNFKPYLVCETINEVLDAAETLKVRKKDGLLMRSILEECVPNKCNWVVWSPRSKVTFQVWNERRNAPKYLKLVDDFVFEFEGIDLNNINYKYIDISLDGSKYSVGFEENFWMDKDDFNVWSKILSVRKPGRKKKMVDF